MLRVRTIEFFLKEFTAMKKEFSSQKRGILLFLTANMAIVTCANQQYRVT